MNKLLGYVLVLIGVGIGVISLYVASFAGVMGKMGLVGGGFDQAIDRNELARQLRREDEKVECGVIEVAKHVPAYLLARGEKRIVLAGELGRERVICGIRLVQNQNIERGVYTLIKGLYYLDGQYREMRPLVEQNKEKCALIPQTEYESWIQGYLLSTQGRIHNVVYDLYKQVEQSRSQVEELCTN